jgi:phage shock protein A
VNHYRRIVRGASGTHASSPALAWEWMSAKESGIADVVTAKKRLQLQEEQLHQQADKLDSQAKQAMSAGREDLARAAIESR